MSVRRTSDHFPRAGSGFKCRRGEIEHRLTSKRTKGTGWTLVPEVPADVKVALTAERPAFGPGGRARCRRFGGQETTMHDATTPASENGGNNIKNPSYVTSVTSRFEKGDAKNRKRAARNIELVTSSTQNLYCTDSREEKREYTHTSNSSKIRISIGRGDAPLRPPTAVWRFQRVTSFLPRHDGGDDPSAEVTQ